MHTDTARENRMDMRRAVTGCVFLACLVVQLVEKTEGHITFFSPKEMMLMKEREGRKDMEPRSDGGQFEEVAVKEVPQMEQGGTFDKTAEIAVRLSPKQLDDVAPVLKEIIHELVEKRQKSK